MGIWRTLMMGIIGAAAGIGGGFALVRSGTLGNQAPVGPWVTGRSFGSAAADPLTRSVVALRGLLALPAAEARYYTAAHDDGGEPLDGRCHYRLQGIVPAARWWSR